MNRFVCLHGHFYQPPRENPWLESIELQDSAAPYHDWNERITAECYEPNIASRILDDEGRIVSIVNNYSRISFNFGPTLLSWLETHAPAVYEGILEADRDSRERFGGHGSALAQVYNHIIMPLATREDKEIQVEWGIADFRHRFGRDPEGLWLSETAVDIETLEVLAAREIRFTILAPSQAARVRPLQPGASWRELAGETIDPTVAYLQRLPSGREIALYFYDGLVSRAVAFQGLLHRGERLAARILGILSDPSRPQLAHVATDGESYGHHHAHGDMALAFALDAIESREQARLTNYGEYLERFPPEMEVEIREGSSWSCIHGVERWRSDCGCHSGGQPGWSQDWRAPLRDALDLLRGRARPLFDELAPELFRDPEAAIRAYVSVIVDRSPDTVARFLEEQSIRELTPEEQVRALKLCELRRQLQLMYTSCGWFFSDLAGIETVQVLRYAGRSLQLLEDLSGLSGPADPAGSSFEEAFLNELERARSNRLGVGNGRELYERTVRPAKATWETVAAHYSISSLFHAYPEKAKLYCYQIDREELLTHPAGRTKLVLGRVRLTSTITRATQKLGFAVLHLGDHNLSAGVKQFEQSEEYEKMSGEIVALFLRGDTTAVLRLLDRTFADHQYNLHSLFGDEKRRVLDSMLQSTLAEAEAAYRHVYEHHGATMRFLAELGVPPPPALSVAAELVLNRSLKRALARESYDANEIGSLLQAAAREGVTLDEALLSFTARQSLERTGGRFFDLPANLARLGELQDKTRIVVSLPFEVDLWRVQNGYYQCMKSELARSQAEALRQKAAATGTDQNDRRAWLRAFLSLGDELHLRLDPELAATVAS